MVVEIRGLRMPIPMNESFRSPTRRRASTATRSPWRRRLGVSAAGLAVLVAALLPAGDALAGSAPRKMGRGLANVATGVIVLPAKVIETTRAHGPFVGATWGLAKGVGWVVATEAVGLFEFVTCPFETPPEFAPILEPEFPWGHYQAAEQRKAKKEVKRRSVFTRDR